MKKQSRVRSEQTEQVTVYKLPSLVKPQSINDVFRKEVAGRCKTTSAGKSRCFCCLHTCVLLLACVNGKMIGNKANICHLIHTITHWCFSKDPGLILIQWEKGPSQGRWLVWVTFELCCFYFDFLLFLPFAP